MHWQLWTTLLLLAWHNAPNQIQAARISNPIVRQDWQSQAQMQRKTGSQIAYPSYKYVQSRHPNRRLSGQEKAASTTTTERPFVRYWNNFVRSVQPNFGLRNLTNPLVNLFNNGNTNIIETLPLQAVVYSDVQHEELPQTSVATTQSANKRKRKRRKQQKRRPTLDSQEQDVPYDYYGNSLPITHPQHQPMYYYGPNDYYGLRRLHHYGNYAPPANYYDSYFEDTTQAEEESQYTPESNLRKLNAKKYTVLRPLSLAFELPSSEPSAQTATDDTETNDFVSDAVGEDIDHTLIAVKTKSDESSSIETASDDDRTSALSESMRNALGTYIRNDNKSQQQANAKPHQQILFAARLVKNN